jgi:predicted RNA binding protein YcfA (HicA-like mRNA interferase family)
VPELKPVSWDRLVKRLKKHGFDGPYQGGKHPYMIKDDLVLVIPNQHRPDISIDLLIRILKRADVKKEDWLKR